MWWDKTKSFLKKFLALSYLFAVALLAIMIMTIIFDDKLIVNSVMINQLALIALLIALPQSIGYVVDTFGKKKTRQYQVSGKCPKCNHKTELLMQEQNFPL